MMPSKETRCDTYYATRRDFADPAIMLNQSYVGKTLVRKSNYDRNAQTYSHMDTIQTAPAGMVNPYSENGNYILRTFGGSKPTPPIYDAEQNGASNLLNYSRSRTGLLNNASESYKSVKGHGYVKVIAPADQQGGNIKSRQQTLKWVGGIWRAK
jgi:hypothetical protein